MLKSSIFMNLESRIVLCEDIGRQVLTLDRRDEGAVLCAKIDQLTPKDLQRVARRLMDSKPSIASFGDCTAIPPIDAINDFVNTVKARTQGQ